MLGYNLWPALQSNQEQTEPQAETQADPTDAPSDVAVDDQTSTTEPEAEKPTAALSEVVELDVENFEQTNEGLWLVEFYAP